MADRREESIAPPRSLSGASAATDDERDVVLPPPPDTSESERTGWFRRTPKAAAEPTHDEPAPSVPFTSSVPASSPMPSAAASGVVRKARLRLVQVDPWSVMKTSFLLSVALGIVTVVAVAIVWSVLGVAGLWDSVNSIVRDSIGDTSGAPFEIQKYLGTSRVLGFTMIVAVIDVVLITAIATVTAFLYNLAATLLGGIEVTFAEDR